jgi:U4/U6.U5 tri-snRNP-associated protein 3
LQLCGGAPRNVNGVARSARRWRASGAKRDAPPMASRKNHGGHRSRSRNRDRDRHRHRHRHRHRNRNRDRYRLP